MRRRLVLAIVALTICASGASPAFADGTTTYILGEAWTLGGAPQYAYGNYGQIYAYAWTPITNYDKHVSSLWVRKDSTHYIELGLVNDGYTDYKYGVGDWSSRCGIFLQFEAPPVTDYYQHYYTSAVPETWVAFEINNHQMYAPGASAWYAAWNGNTILHGQNIPTMWNAPAVTSSERFGGYFVDCRSSYRYLQYKRIQGNYAAYPFTHIYDQDVYWRGVPVSGYTNRWYATRG